MLRTGPDSPFLWEGEASLSWREVGAAVRRIQGWLLQEGCFRPETPHPERHPADLRGRALAMTPELSRPSVLLMLACIDAGVPLILLHPRWTPLERSAALEGLEPRVTLSTPEEVADGVAGALKASVPLDAFQGRALVSPESALTGIFTSGSTGKPRLVVLDRRACVVAAQGCIQRLGIDASDRWRLSLPLAHVGGLGILLRCWLAGASLVLPEAGEASPVTPAEQVALIQRAGVTRLSVVPTQLLRLLDAWQEVGALRPGLVGGAAAPASLLARAYALGIPVLPTWGMTEACSQIASLTPQQLPALLQAAQGGNWDRDGLRPGSGLPLPGWQVRVEAGQLLISGPSLFAGYQTPTGLVRVLEPDGFFATGDLGQILPDGSIQVEGRRADRIVTGGENVSPLEVEEVIAAHPQVADVLVYGISDPEWGERVVAGVVWRGGEPKVEAEAQLDAWVRSRLAGYKRPRAWRFVAGLAYLENGKLDRAGSRKRIEAYASRINSDPSYSSPPHGETFLSK